MSDISTYTEYGQIGTMEAEKVGNLVSAAESGGVGIPDLMVINYDSIEGTVDKTFDEIKAQIDKPGPMIMVRRNRLFDYYDQVSGSFGQPTGYTFYSISKGGTGKMKVEYVTVNDDSTVTTSTAYVTTSDS